VPSLDVVSAGGPSAGGQPLAASEFAARRIVGVVFVVLIFITLVIYGMWVAAGVVAEKSSRVMEMLISAASPKQLVVGKVVGTGLLAAYGGFWILGFVLYSLIYAAAGSLVSRAEDLQVLALPLSLIAIAGYLMAVLALSGGLTPLMRVASFVPFWSPFVMLTRLTVGRAEPWEIGLSFALLLAGIAIVGVLAVRVYAAGVLLYGQRPGVRAIVGAILSPGA
jgi:ABC-2 type transport system permease protein